jgi:hypothetical protein
VGLALPGVLVFLVIAAVIAAVAAWKVAGAVGAWWSAGPNYRLAPTASCLRDRGYAASRIPIGKGDMNFPGIWVNRRGDYLMDIYFTPNTETASKVLAGMSDSIGPRRNVVTNLEDSVDATDSALACLRTGR